MENRSVNICCTSNGVNCRQHIIKQCTYSFQAKTNDPKLSHAQQAVKKMTAQAYMPRGDSKNYMNIGIDSTELRIGEQLKVSLSAGQSPGLIDQSLTYMVSIVVICYLDAPQNIN